MFCKYCGNKIDGLSCSVCGRKAVLAKRSTELEKKMAEKVPAAPKAAAGDAEYQRGFLDGKKSGLQEGYRNGLSDAAKTQGTEKKQPAPLQGRMLVSVAALAAIVGLIAGGLSFLAGYKNGQKSVRDEIAKAAGTELWEEVQKTTALDEVSEEEIPAEPDEFATEEADLPDKTESSGERASSAEQEEPEEEVPADTEPSEKTDTDAAGDETGSIEISIEGSTPSAKEGGEIQGPTEELPPGTETDGPLPEGMKRKYPSQMDSLHDRSGTGLAQDLRSAVNETAGEAAENPEGNDNIQKDGESKIDKRLNMCVPEK